MLVTGTLEPRKNLPRLIEAFATLDPGQRGEAQLVLAGAQGWQTDATLSGIAAHGDSVVALGFVDEEDLPCLYRGAEVFCLRLPLRGLRDPGARGDAVGHGRAHVVGVEHAGGRRRRRALRDPRDVADIRRGLAELLADEHLRARCAAAGPARASLFDWDRTAATVLSELQGLGSA